MLTITVVLRGLIPKCLQLRWFCAARCQNAYKYYGVAAYDSKQVIITMVLQLPRTARQPGHLPAWAPRGLNVGPDESFGSRLIRPGTAIV